MVKVVVEVVDYNTLKPVDGAFVSIGAVSGTTRDGKVTLNVSPGTHTIKITHRNYDPIVDSILVNRPKKFTYRMIPLVKIL